ncbi:DUF6153 family protein [Streptomyces sp. NPDC048606]|uniref:DUF6153 family protein n=1 Tax=Streptomyces sp. NPDC048606 TaxID=3154726 RepID=UPI00341E9140
MSETVRRASGPFALPRRLWLVLAVLTGLLGMHGLGPGGIPAKAPAAVAAAFRPALAAATSPHDTARHAAPSHSTARHTAPSHDAARPEASPHGTVVDRTTPVGARDAAVPAAPCACPHEGPGGGHAEHADPTCAAPGTGAPPVLSGPAPAPGALGAPAPAAHGIAPASAVDGRAPPSLSELQLLRV